MSSDAPNKPPTPGQAERSTADDKATDMVLRESSHQIVVEGSDDHGPDTRQIGDEARGPGGAEADELEGFESGLLRPRQLAGRTLQGRYRLDHVLGSGGMGDVYLGHHLSLDMPIAVKVLHPHVALVSEYARRFRREAKASSLLHHRNVVQVIDFGADGDLLYMVMELLHGQSLGEWLLDMRDPPPLSEVEAIMGQLLDAFEAAHTIGIVHRDLKPENIFLTEESDGQRIVKVVDFGLARLSDPIDQGPTITQDDVVSGTPQYMSPEQCRSLSVGPSADLYAVGCVLTALLQLGPPFEADTAMAVMTRQMFWPPPPLDRPSHAEPVPPLLERLRLDLLAKSPSKRPADISDVRARFAEAMSAEATAARLPPRSHETPAGTREDRVPEWTHGAVDPPLPTADTATMRVALRRLTTSPDGVMTDCAIGLAAHGASVKLWKDEGAPTDYDLAILDAGTEFEQAKEILAAWQAGGGPPTIVCADGLGTEAMRQLIAAGVGDVVTYPVEVDVLLRKLRRLHRRKR